MPDSESPPPQALSLGSPWLDAAAVGGLLLAANAIAAPQDPGWLSLNPSPWLLLPVLTGLGHGFRWGFLFGSLASLSILGLLYALHAGTGAVPGDLVYYFSFPAAGLAAGGIGRSVTGHARSVEARESVDGKGEECFAEQPDFVEVPELASARTPAQLTPAVEEVEAENLAVLRGELEARLAEREAEMRHLARQRDVLAAGLTERDEALKVLEQLRAQSAAELRAGAEASLADYEARAAEFASRFAQAEVSRQNLESQGDELRGRLAEREAILENLSAQRDQLADRLTERDRELESLASQRDALRAQLEERLAAIQSQLTEAGEQQLRQASENEELLNRLQTGRDELQARLAERGAELEALTYERDDLRTRLNAAQQAAEILPDISPEIELGSASGNDGALYRLQHERDELSARLAEFGESIGHLEADRQNLAARLEEREISHVGMSGQIQSLSDGLAARDEVIGSLQGILAQEEAEHTAALESFRALAVEYESRLAAAAENEARAERELTTTAALGAAASGFAGSREAGALTKAEDRQARQEELEQRVAEFETALRQVSGQRDELAAQLEERGNLLHSLAEERELLTARLSDREDALRRAEEMRDSLNVRLNDRNALLESMATRPVPVKRRLPSRNGVLQIHSSGRLGTTDEAEAAAALAPAEPSQLQELLLPLDADVAPLDGRIRALFAKDAGPIFPTLLQLLEDIAGVTDAAVYQIDGQRLQRSALQGAEGKLPEMLPLAAAEIAHLAVTRQSFVTCRQVWATVPAQTSPWLAALPWPTTEMHSSALLLIHRMHFGAVNWQTFSRIQMVCRWVALFMELHGIKTTGNASADAGAGAGGPLVVTPDILRRAAVDAAAAHREHTLPSSALTLQLRPDASSSQSEQLLATILPQLRPTDLVAVHPAGGETPGAAENGGAGGRGAALEVLLTFSDMEDAETIIRRFTEVLSGDPELHAAVKVGAPTQIGAPARN